MRELHSDAPAEPEWHRLRPLLDDAMEELSAEDREAVVMRFFLQRSLREIGRLIHPAVGLQAFELDVRSPVAKET